MKSLLILMVVLFSFVFTSCKNNESKKVIDYKENNKETILDTKSTKNESELTDIENDSLLNATDFVPKKIKVPFDYDKYIDLCYLKEDRTCGEKFPSYKSAELPLITKLINDKLNKNTPDRIYCIENSGLDFDTYIFMIRDEIEDYLSTTYLINVRDNKIIASQIISQSPDGEAPEDAIVPNQTFIVNKDVSVSVFDKIYKKKNKLSMTYIINPDGTIKAK